MAELVAAFHEAESHPTAIESDTRCDLSAANHAETKLLICDLAGMVGDNPLPDTGAAALGMTTLILPLKRAPRPPLLNWVLDLAL